MAKINSPGYMATKFDKELVYKDQIASFSLLLGSIIIILAFAVLLISSLGFLFGWSISSSNFILSFCLTIVFFWTASKSFSKNYLVAAVIVFFLLLAAITFISNSFYDISWDGQAYHQEAVIQLSKGWNPFYQITPPAGAYGHELWLTHYTKGTWIYATSVYQLTNSIESAKVFNILLIISSFFLGISALIHLPRINLSQTLILSGILAFNPVSVCQSLSFYIDGQLSSLLVSLLSLSYLLIVRSEHLKLLIFVYSATICILANIKFTGLVYSLIFIFFLIVWLLIQKNIKLAVKVAIAGSLSFLLGVGFIGYNPYITNIMYKGHPFYPLAGADKVDIISDNLPKNFIGKNRIEKLFLSTFSEPISTTSNRDNSQLKLPFTIKKNWEFVHTDVRVAGFGPLFSEAIVLSLIVCLISLRMDFNKTLITLRLISFLMLSILINPEAWWARYAPQFWIVPIVFTLLGLSFKNRLLNFISSGLIVVLAANVLIISNVYLSNNYKQTKAIEQQFRNISSDNQTITVNFYKGLSSNRIRFLERGIKYHEVKDFKELPCKGEQIIGSQTLFCASKR